MAASRFDVLGGAPERTAADRVLALLVDAIRAGVFEVGDRLPNLRELAKELGISHVVARQAIEVLTGCEVLDVRQGRGGGIFLVNLAGLTRALAEIYDVPTIEEARSLLEARFLVERSVVERAVRLRDAGDLSDLGALVSRLNRSRTMAEFTELTVRFHLRLALAARNPILTSFLREVLNRMALFGIERTGVGLTEKAVIARGRPLYERFYAALVHSDPAAADRCVDDHKAYVQDVYEIDFLERPA